MNQENKIVSQWHRFSSDDIQRIIVGVSWIGVFAFLFVTCRENSKLPVPSESQPLLLGTEITANVSASSRPNHYRVQLRWKRLNYSTILYRKTGFGLLGGTELCRLDATKHFYLDENVRLGETYTYILEKKDGGSLAKIELSIPLSQDYPDPTRLKVNKEGVFKTL